MFPCKQSFLSLWTLRGFVRTVGWIKRDRQFIKFLRRSISFSDMAGERIPEAPQLQMGRTLAVSRYDPGRPAVRKRPPPSNARRRHVLRQSTVNGGAPHQRLQDGHCAVVMARTSATSSTTMIFNPGVCWSGLTETFGFFSPRLADEFIGREVLRVVSLRAKLHAATKSTRWLRS